jgi:hypothetical protein
MTHCIFECPHMPEDGWGWGNGSEPPDEEPGCAECESRVCYRCEIDQEHSGLFVGCGSLCCCPHR